MDVAFSPAYQHNRNTLNTETTARVQWWQQFRDEQLTSLVNRTAVANHDIRIAVERVNQARAGTTVSSARLFPSVNVMASGSDSRTGLPMVVKQSMPDTRALRAGVDVGWEVDLFGGNSAAARAAASDAESAGYGVHGAQLITVSEVARQYFIWHGARERLKILESLLQTRRDTERLARSRNREGMVSALDVAMAAGETANMEASLPALQTLMAVAESRIAVLTGSNPSVPVPELHGMNEFHWIFPNHPPSGQPADLLRRRPDLLAAEERLSAASSRLAESKANRFPKIFLSALFGTQKLTLNDALSLSASPYSNVLGAFVLPLFNAGRVQAGIDISSAREQEALLAYEQITLRAIEDVENSLVALSGEQQRLDALNVAVKEQEQAVEHANSLYREGEIDLLQLLEVQRAQLASKLALAESKSQREVAYVQLYKALGGGWQALPDPANFQTENVVPSALNSTSGVK